jgi:hypothetical protein
MEAYAQQLRLAHGFLSFEIVPDTARCHSVVSRKAEHSPRRQRPTLSRWDSAPPLLTISSDHVNGIGSSPMESSRKVMRKSSSARDFMPRLPNRSIDAAAPPLLLPSREMRRLLPAPPVQLSPAQAEAVLVAAPISPAKLLAARDFLPRRPHRQSIDSVVASPSHCSKQIVQWRST